MDGLRPPTAPHCLRGVGRTPQVENMELGVQGFQDKGLKTQLLPREFPGRLYADGGQNGGRCPHGAPTGQSGMAPFPGFWIQDSAVSPDARASPEHSSKPPWQIIKARPLKDQRTSTSLNCLLETSSRIFIRTHKTLSIPHDKIHSTWRPCGRSNLEESPR